MSLNWKPGDTLITINNVVVDLIGDPHLGRAFRHGVPINRLGEREQIQWRVFKERLMKTTGQVCVCMGDIFDKFVVSPTVVMFAAAAYREAALANPTVLYVLLRGNHDGSRDSTLRSSFDILEALLSDVENIVIAADNFEIIEFDAVKFLLIPWHPFVSATEMVDEVSSSSRDVSFTAIFGHWDIDDFGGAKENLIPIDGLKQLTSLVITGHVHKSEHRVMDEVDVLVTGSMLPYAHGEDLTGKIYRTVSAEEARKLVGTGEALNMCLRVELEPEEEIDFEIDCLQLQVRRKNADIEDIQTDFGDFDMKKLFDTVFAEENVSSDTAEDFWARLRATNPDIV